MLKKLISLSTSVPNVFFSPRIKTSVQQSNNFTRTLLTLSNSKMHTPSTLIASTISTSKNSHQPFHCTAENNLNGLLMKMHEREGPPAHKKCGRDTKPVTGHNFLKGTVLKVMIRHPKKPNSGNRKCAIVKLSNGIETCAYIPGEAHNLQEHSQVHVRGGRKRDLIGVKAVVIRGKLDCAPTKRQMKKQRRK